MKSMLADYRNIHFCDAGDVMWDQLGVVHALIDHGGLTLDGIRELNVAFANI